MTCHLCRELQTVSSPTGRGGVSPAPCARTHSSGRAAPSRRRRRRCRPAPAPRPSRRRRRGADPCAGCGGRRARAAGERRRGRRPDDRRRPRLRGRWSSWTRWRCPSVRAPRPPGDSRERIRRVASHPHGLRSAGLDRDEPSGRRGVATASTAGAAGSRATRPRSTRPSPRRWLPRRTGSPCCGRDRGQRRGVDQVRPRRAPRHAARPDRCRQDDRVPVHAPGPPRRAAGDPDGVRGTRREPDPDRVPSDEARAG